MHDLKKIKATFHGFLTTSKLCLKIPPSLKIRSTENKNKEHIDSNS